MTSDFETRRAQEAAQRAQEAQDRRAMLEALPQALEAVTGQPWSLEALHPDAPKDDPAQANGGRLVAADGFGLLILGGNWGEGPRRMSARVNWPRKPGAGAARTLYRDAPGVPWDAPEPGTGFSIDRPAAQVARQIARVLVTPDHKAAAEAMAAHWAAEQAEEAAAARWRETLADLVPVEAEGAHRRLLGNRPEAHPRTLTRPGGHLALPLDPDPDTAAAQVRAILAALEGVAQGRRILAPLGLAEAEALAEAGADARKQHWNRRDLAGLNSALRRLGRALTATDHKESNPCR